MHGGYDSSRKIIQQIKFDDKVKGRLWQQIIKAKIRKQAEVLERFGKENAELLAEYADIVKEGDATNREGHAAKVYFNSLFGKGFIRGDNDPVNQALNYGYIVLLSYFNREISSQGYLTQLGIHHKNTFNEFNFSCDLMEPFRPLIDYNVCLLDNTHDLDKDKKIKLANIFNERIIYDRQKMYLSNFIKQYCTSAFSYLANGEGSLACYRINDEEN